MGIRGVRSERMDSDRVMNLFRPLAQPAALALAVLLLVGVAGCDESLEQQADATAQQTATRQAGEAEASEPLTLTLSGPETCVTEPGRGASPSRIGANGERYYDAPGLSGVAETPVRWQVEGGTPPYVLKIDGETRDAEQEYARTWEFGLASVSCALRTGDVTYAVGGEAEFRRYTGEVLVNSGLKTIHATVTDGEGRTAEATADVYVVLSLVDYGVVLRAGERYHVEYSGTSLMFTVPDDFDLEFCGLEGEEGDGDSFSYSLTSVVICYPVGSFGASVSVTISYSAGGEDAPVLCSGEEGWRSLNGLSDQSLKRRVGLAFDELVESIQLLTVNRAMTDDRCQDRGQANR